MRYGELLEQAQISLYHSLWAAKAIDIFQNDLMPAKWEHDIPGYGKVMGNSFSRNPNIDLGERSIRIEFDKNVLLTRNKIMPLDGELAFRHQFKYSPITDRKLRKDRDQMVEEFVVGDIKFLHRTIRSITWMNTVENLQLIKQGIQVTTEYATKWRLPFIILPKVIKRMQEYRQYQEFDDD